MSAKKRNERGAFLPEYALVFATFALGLMGVAGVIHERTSDFYEGSSSGIGAVPAYEVSRTTLGWSPTTTLPVTIPTTTTTTTTTTIPSTTTSTTSTTSSTTSTTITTTPTTLPVTTTTEAPTVTAFVFQLEDRSYNESDGDWRARVRITIGRSDSQPHVQGAVVTGTFVTADGGTRTRSCTTNSSGKCQMVWGNRKNNDDPTTFTVTNVSSTPGWDGVQASITLEKP
jgi:hypothetical protein